MKSVTVGMIKNRVEQSIFIECDCGSTKLVDESTGRGIFPDTFFVYPAISQEKIIRCCDCGKKYKITTLITKVCISDVQG